MQELIKIEVKENGQKLVSARELHEFLQVGRDFTTWIKGRIEKYDFVENVDFTVVRSFHRNGGKGGRPQEDYAITIEMAKELCMVENNDYGKMARRYFIECEKKLNTPVIVTEYDKAESEMKLVKVAAEILKLNDSSTLACLTNVLENHNIPTNILPQYTESSGQLLPATELLKRNNLEISTIKFNKILLEQGIVKELERPSTKGVKKFKSLVDTYWGANQVSPKNPKETQILYYADKFGNLLQKLNLI